MSVEGLLQVAGTFLFWFTSIYERCLYGLSHFRLPTDVPAKQTVHSGDMRWTIQHVTHGKLLTTIPFKEGDDMATIWGCLDNMLMSNRPCTNVLLTDNMAKTSRTLQKHRLHQNMHHTGNQKLISINL